MVPQRFDVRATNRGSDNDTIENYSSIAFGFDRMFGPPRYQLPSTRQHCINHLQTRPMPGTARQACVLQWRDIHAQNGGRARHDERPMSKQEIICELTLINLAGNGKLSLAEAKKMAEDKFEANKLWYCGYYGEFKL